MKQRNARLSALCAMVLLAAPGVAGAAAQPTSAPSSAPSVLPTSGATGMPGPGQGQPDTTPGPSGSSSAGSSSGAGGAMPGGTMPGSMGTQPGTSSEGTSPGAMHGGGMMHGTMSHGSGMGSMMKMSDTAFIAKAAQGGMTEVKAAKVALQKTSDPRVKAYATKMIADHVPNNAKLAAIVKSEGKMVPMSLDAMHQAELAKLQTKSGLAFDQAYLAGQVADHKKMLALMQNEAANGSDPKLVAFAKMTAPTVQMHLSLAQKDMTAKM